MNGHPWPFTIEQISGAFKCTTKFILNSIDANQSINTFNARDNTSRLATSEMLKNSKVAFNLGTNIVASNKLMDTVLLFVSILYYYWYFFISKQTILLLRFI